MPQESLWDLLVNEGHKRTAVSAPRCVQLDYMVAVINTALEGRRIPHVLRIANWVVRIRNFYSIRAFTLSTKSAFDYGECTNCEDRKSRPEIAAISTYSTWAPSSLLIQFKVGDNRLPEAVRLLGAAGAPLTVGHRLSIFHGLQGITSN